MPQEEQQESVKRIQDALSRAYEARAQYDMAKQLKAGGHEASVQKQRIRFQQLVLHGLSLLRPYLVSELHDRYWEGATVYDGDDGTIVGLQKLMLYRGATKESGEWQTGDHGREYVSSEEPVLLPPSAVRHALDLLAAASYLLGFSASHSKRREKFNASVLQDDERAAEVIKSGSD